MTDYVSKCSKSKKSTKMARLLAHTFCAVASLVAGKRLEVRETSTSCSVFIPVQVTLTCVVAGGQSEADAGSKGISIPDSIMQ